MKVKETVILAITMLLGEAGVDYAVYVGDEDFWKWRLYMVRN
jgi:hypothetical protein